MYRVLIGRFVLALSSTCLATTAVAAQSSSDVPVMAVGERLRLVMRPVGGERGTLVPSRVVEGLVLQVDSTSLAFRTSDGQVRRATRTDVETAQVRGRSRWWGAAAGLVVAAPIESFACRNERYECAQGGLIGIAGVVLGASIGWPRWSEVRFP